MILEYQGENHRVLAFGRPLPFLENKEVHVAVFRFTMVKSGDNYVYPNATPENPIGYPSLQLVTTQLINNSLKINNETLQIVPDGVADPNGVAGFDFLTSRTVGDIYSAEEVGLMTVEEIRAIRRYDMDATDIENFILANGWLTGVRI